MKQTHTEKVERAASQKERVDAINADHPKEWDTYVAERQKQVKEQSHAK